MSETRIIEKYKRMCIGNIEHPWNHLRLGSQNKNIYITFLLFEGNIYINLNLFLVIEKWKMKKKKKIKALTKLVWKCLYHKIKLTIFWHRYASCSEYLYLLPKSMLPKAKGKDVLYRIYNYTQYSLINLSNQLQCIPNQKF